MQEEILYANLLEDKRVYNLARASWKRFFDKLAKEMGVSYVPYINQKQSGKPEYDGNPIFSAYVPALNRAVRIIQVAPGEGGEEITSWVDTIALHEGQPEVEDLVLDMVLSRAARERAGELVKRWLGERVAVGV
ncbi:MAG: hypothetical protein WA004_21325 [Saprospiraceae bacterium]